MNQKTLPIVIAVILILLLGGGFFLLNNKKTAQPASNTSTAASSEKTGAFTSIQDALSRSLSLKCEYKNADGTTVISYIKNGSVRGDVTKDGVETSGSLIKDKKMYVWTTNPKSGFMMDLSTITPPTNSGVKAPTSNDYQKSMATLEQYKDSCKQAVVADSLFAIPTDIKFTDYSSMMKQMMPSGIPSYDPKVMDQYKNYLPK